MFWARVEQQAATCKLDGLQPCLQVREVAETARSFVLPLCPLVHLDVLSNQVEMLRNSEIECPTVVRCGPHPAQLLHRHCQLTYQIILNCISILPYSLQNMHHQHVVVLGGGSVLRGLSCWTPPPSSRCGEEQNQGICCLLSAPDLLTDFVNLAATTAERGKPTH